MPLAGETFKGKSASELRTLKEVKNLPDYAGIIEDGYVIVDVDDEVQSEILFNIVKDRKLNTKVMKTTRGMHFYFKTSDRTTTNKVGSFTACGLKVDMKLGVRNSYVSLKHQGVPRETIYETDDIDVIPVWLSPINYTFPFLTMEKGDGRNDSLFKYILTLQTHEYSKQDIREILTVINNYVLEDPLPDSELRTIMRDEAFKEEIFFGGKQGSTFLFDRFAKFLVSEHNLVRINNQLHVYKGGVYVDAHMNLEHHMIKHIPRLSYNHRNETKKYVEILVYENSDPAPANYIAFNNGIYDIKTDEFLAFDPDIIITNKIPWDYNPDAYCEIVDTTLDKMAVNDKQIRLIMEEVIGYTFYRRNEMGKVPILTGEKSNGKSTFLTMIRKLLGYNNVSALDLGELDDRFRTVELFGKLANIGDDIGSGYIEDTGVFKKLATGEAVTVERKGEDAFQFNNYSKLIFSANDIPRMKDRSGAALRRLLIVPFNATFSPDDPDYNPHIVTDLTTREAMEYLILIGIEGLKRVLHNRSFTQSEKVEDELLNYELMNNPIKLFFKDHLRDDILDTPTIDLYNSYKAFCHENSLQPLGRIVFTRTANEHYKTISETARVDGKRCQVFKEEEL